MHKLTDAADKAINAAKASEAGGEARLAAEKYDEAARDFSEFLKLHDCYPPIVLALAKSQVDGKHPDEARKTLLRYKEFNAKSVDDPDPDPATNTKKAWEKAVTDAQKMLSDIPSVAFELADPEHDNVTVSLDGKKMNPDDFASGIGVTEGRHTCELGLDGYVPLVVEVPAAKASHRVVARSAEDIRWASWSNVDGEVPREFRDALAIVRAPVSEPDQRARWPKAIELFTRAAFRASESESSRAAAFYNAGVAALDLRNDLDALRFFGKAKRLALSERVGRRMERQAERITTGLATIDVTTDPDASIAVAVAGDEESARIAADVGLRAFDLTVGGSPLFEVGAASSATSVHAEQTSALRLVFPPDAANRYYRVTIAKEGYQTTRDFGRVGVSTHASIQARLERGRRYAIRRLGSGFLVTSGIVTAAGLVTLLVGATAKARIENDPTLCVTEPEFRCLSDGDRQWHQAKNAMIAGAGVLGAGFVGLTVGTVLELVPVKGLDDIPKDVEVAKATAPRLRIGWASISVDGSFF